MGAAALGLTRTLCGNAGNHGFLIISTLGVKQRAVVMTLLYQKSLRLSNAARQSSSVGQIVNLMSNDANRFAEFSMFVIR